MSQHVILTCENHPDLRWSTKDIAVSVSGRYTGTRSLFFNGVVQHTPPQFYSDLSGMYCTEFPTTGMVRECDCPYSFLTIAPEEFELRRLREEKENS